MMPAYYNEHDPKAAAWLRELIARNLIAPGDVDERSILDVRPDELDGYTQCHFFAGIGVWSYALRQAGWPDDRPVWTGSCPCQPFSAAGKGGGFADERHLWPAWHHLIRERRPGVVFGEQVASKDGLAWLDLVRSDLESEGYAVGALDLCAAGFGAPHIRQRLYFVADAAGEQRRAGRLGAAGDEPGAVERSTRLRAAGRLADADGGAGQRGVSRPAERAVPQTDGRPDWLDDPQQPGLEGHAGDGDDSDEPGRDGAGAARPTPAAGESGLLADADGRHSGPEREQRGGEHGLIAQDGGVGELADAERDGGRADEPERGAQGRNADGRDGAAVARRPGSTNGFWRDADWIRCRDGRWRPVEPGSTPLVAGAPARMGRLRGYGNAINAEVAKGFIEAYMKESKP